MRSIATPSVGFRGKRRRARIHRWSWKGTHTRFRTQKLPPPTQGLWGKTRLDQGVGTGKPNRLPPSTVCPAAPSGPNAPLSYHRLVAAATQNKQPAQRPASARPPPRTRNPATRPPQAKANGHRCGPDRDPRRPIQEDIAVGQGARRNTEDSIDWHISDELSGQRYFLTVISNDESFHQ